MNSYLPHHNTGRSDAPLWAAALVLSVVLNAAVLLALSSDSMRKLLSTRDIPPPTPQAATEHVLQMLFTPPEPELEPAEDESRQRFARTSADQQSAEPPERSDFIGERDTRAASELAPDADAPPLPAQAGVEQRSPDDIETTESDFRDGPLDMPDADDSAPASSPAVTAVPQVPGVEVETPGEAETREVVEATPPATERLLEGPYTTEIPVPLVPEPEEEKPPAPEPEEAPPQGLAEAPPEKETEKTPVVDPTVNPARTTQSQSDPTQGQPGFRGHQRKTAMRGSISRTGRSALDVQDNALGRYQAQISRAVELEWQRNCVRHRDFITPGFLTVRFFVEPAGRVRTVEFVGEMSTGEVQKGFTLNSIRNASIPPMPKELRRELGDEPLELIFNFYF